MKFIISIVVSITATFSFAFGQSKSGDIGKCQVVVGENEASFTFPIKSRKHYEWSSGGLQLTWNVRIKNKSRNYDVEYYLFTPMGSTPTESGDFKGLLNAGQVQMLFPVCHFQYKDFSQQIFYERTCEIYRKIVCSL